MCGIAGFFHGEPSPGTDALLAQMGAQLRHRGPDDDGWVCFDPTGGVLAKDTSGPSPGSPTLAGLVHRRLSIIDLSPAGHQPMRNEDGSIWISYNGEVYNFLDLRRDLEARGHRFVSQTDTEVLVHGYEEWGLELLPRLNGIFAFAIWDCRQRRLVLARDRLGIKPLYVSRGPWGLAFASELRALLCHPGISATLDPQALHAYLSFLWVPEPRTMFTGIDKLPAGSCLVFDGLRMERHTYWRPTFRTAGSVRSVDEAAEELLVTMRRAVARQMVSDVPLGLFLSGGLDSSLLLACAAEESSGPVRTYSIGFQEKDLAFERQDDDLAYARRVARHFGAEAHEFILTPDVANLLPRVVESLEDPIADPAAISAYLICEAARPDVTVLLSGQGSDEIFAGYPWHVAGRLVSLYQQIPRFIRTGLIEPLAGALPGARRGRFVEQSHRLKRFCKSASLPFEESYVGLCSYLSEAEKQALYSPDFMSQIGEADAREKHFARFEEVSDQDPLNRMLYVDSTIFLPSLNLAYTDKMSMANSVEVRVPFLDNDVIEWAFQAPPAWKLRGSMRKFILKKAAERVLPQEIVYRKKLGFGAPIRSWLVTDLREMVGDLLSEDRIRRRGFFDPAAIQRLLTENATGQIDRNHAIYALLTLELWHQRFVDQPSRAVQVSAGSG